MFWKKTKENTASMHWYPLESKEQLDELITESEAHDVLIYKHSTRCGISSMALSRLERGWTEDLNRIKPYFLDLLAHRDLSNEVAHLFEIPHESPQLLLIRNGQVVYHDSHMNISADRIREEV